MELKMSFCLVTMPYSRIELSSVALGLLQATLKRDGLEARSIYANILFAEKIGTLAYTRVSLFRPRLGVAEWTFAHIAFPEFSPDINEYLKLVMTVNEVYASIDRNELEDLLFGVRRNAETFIDEMAGLILDGGPRIVGCSSTFCQHVPSLALLRRIRELAPEIVTVMGGANCETIMGKSTHALFPWVDYVVSGEADGLISPLTRQILENGKEVAKENLPVGVFGPAHRKVRYPENPCNSPDRAPRALTESLNNCPTPDFHDFVDTIQSVSGIRDLIVPGLTVESSRGCWWGQRKGCVFCGFNGKGMKFRSKDPGKFVDELAELRRLYGIDGIETVDNILDMNYLKTVLPMIKSAGSPYRLYYEIKSNLQRNHVRILREAGVIWVQTGIESLNTNILKLMNKGCKAWQNIQILKWLREFGIRVHWNMLFDFPGDKDEWYSSISDIVPLLTHLQSPVKVVPLEFCRFSVYHENQKLFGLKLRASSALNYVYPVNQNQLDDLVYFFEDEVRSAGELNPIVALLTERQVFKILRRRIEEWRQLFWFQKVKLEMEIVGDELVIRDTRPLAVAYCHIYNGLKRDIYLAADGAPQKETLIQKFAESGTKVGEIEEICQEFLDNKLALEIDGRFLGLAVRGPSPELPSAVEYPGGVVIHKEYAHLVKQAAR
jgi:ribosomal peptide maturation radical SAM protein 1